MNALSALVEAYGTRKLARDAGISPTTVKLIRLGELIPSPDTAAKLLANLKPAEELQATLVGIWSEAARAKVRQWDALIPDSLKGEN